jgi:hypothetical protein
MATAYKPEAGDEIPDHEAYSQIDAFVNKLHTAIQESRSKMTDEQAAEAEKKTKEILDRATSYAKSSRHTA